MMARLAERSAGKVPVDVKPKEPLQWQKPVKTGQHGQGYILSECGTFSVTKDMHELGFNYSAWDWRPKKLGKPAVNLGIKQTKDEAIALCEAAR
jgi:hypothetical protein